MGSFSASISDDTAEWISRQRLFFVATAPLGGSGHVNVSPKGLDTFSIIGPNQVAYLDLTGSGAETIAHLRENGRTTLMFCAFEGNPDIVRLYGRGRVIFPDDDAFAGLVVRFEFQPGIRSVILVDVEKVGTSCGYGVPLMDFVEDRDRLARWALAKGEDAMPSYWASKNSVSLDGLPAVGD
ncbi:MAG: pyridoxamine 5'-phosphate oxidase family protein [Acidimicrobiia bacterium]|nr:pyridoxamine 5'-phosphate oxidase family protein [Acidimicrobiia bacterium]MDH5420671.1 pyridoxamine 5'-phosphate oxidase family protein [Acidimicrobiia bacterium]MDH5503453.1 pyridoxamine 5'-phosphate oxidase family protein [Acidimicrobiia bacterium]